MLSTVLSRRHSGVLSRVLAGVLSRLLSTVLSRETQRVIWSNFDGPMALRYVKISMG